MSEDMVMRSVYLRPSEDNRLRQLAFDNNVSKSDLIRSAISAKLAEWIQDPKGELILKDLELGRRATAAERAAGQVPAKAAAPVKGAASVKAPASTKAPRKSATAAKSVRAPVAVPAAPSREKVRSTSSPKHANDRVAEPA